jgi:ubiquinone/menaquinone biosynthesis C-methylase UbiE
MALIESMEPKVLTTIAIATLTLAVIVVVTGQYRKPRWWLGRLFLWMMNVRHSRVTDWGLQEVPLEKHFTILDVGCGGGRTIQKLAAIASEGKVYGIDHSAASVAAARGKNARWLAEDRVDIQQGSVSDLPFPDGMFDVVTAVETHYYWPDLVADLCEIWRVLKPGGRLVVIAEAYKGRRFDAFFRPAMKLLRAKYLSVSEHHEMFSAAGYCDTVVLEEPKKGWICAMGRRPS